MFNFPNETRGGGVNNHLSYVPFVRMQSYKMFEYH